MSRSAIHILAPLLAVLLAACGAEPEPAEAEERRGRAETQNIRNTDAVGYSGSAVADKVDGALEANEDRQRRLEEAEAAE